jgi:hypothetical protein
MRISLGARSGTIFINETFFHKCKIATVIASIKLLNERINLFDILIDLAISRNSKTAKNLPNRAFCGAL